MKKVKPLCDHDIQEILKFQQFLEDKQTMKPKDLYRKYQEYCGLSDAELAAIEARPDSTI